MKKRKSYVIGFGAGAPEPKFRIEAPEAKHVKAEALRGILGALPEEIARRVTNIWIGADGTISIDLAELQGGEHNEIQRPAGAAD